MDPLATKQLHLQLLRDRCISRRTFNTKIQPLTSKITPYVIEHRLKCEATAFFSTLHIFIERLPDPWEVAHNRLQKLSVPIAIRTPLCDMSSIPTTPRTKGGMMHLCQRQPRRSATFPLGGNSPLPILPHVEARGPSNLFYIPLSICQMKLPQKMSEARYRFPQG